MAVSAAYPTYFVCNYTNFLETSPNFQPHLFQQSQVDKTHGNSANLPRSVHGHLLNSENEPLSKEVNHIHDKYEPEFFIHLEGVEGCESSVHGSKIICSSALRNREMGKLNPQCNIDTVSDFVKESSKNVNGKKFGFIPKYVKCFSCERIVKEDHFCEHLIFGSVKCSNCNETINDCQSFQVWTTEYSLGVASCEHSLSYCAGPAEYLSKKISESIQDVNEIQHLSIYFENYINKLDSLREQKPWKGAIAACREYMVNRESPISPSSNSKSKQKESYFKHLTSKVRLTEHDKQTEPIKMCKNSLSTKCSRRTALKHTSSFKHKGKLEKELHDSKTSKLSQRHDLEFIEVPEDGFYYVSKVPVDECPNCYTFLSPYWATVNVNSFLVTVTCESCKLAIYITSPQVEIVTDSSSMMLCVQENVKTKLKTKRRTFAPQTYLKI